MSVGLFLSQPEPWVKDSMIHVIVYHLYRQSIEPPEAVWPVEMDVQVETSST